MPQWSAKVLLTRSEVTVRETLHILPAPAPEVIEFTRCQEIPLEKKMLPIEEAGASDLTVSVQQPGLPALLSCPAPAWQWPPLQN